MLTQQRADCGLTDRFERRGLMDALNASQSLVWFDGAGMVVDANANACRMFAYDDANFIKQDYFVLCGSNARNQLGDKREWAHIAAGEVHHTERSFKAKDGREIWSSVNFSALLNSNGSTRRVVAIFIDMAKFAWKPNDTRRVFGG